MRLRYPLILLIVLLLAGCSPDPVVWGPGVVAPAEPDQGETQAGSWDYKGNKITALAAFEIRARVLSVRHYRQGREATLSPTDLALGWGNMSDEKVIEQLSIRQSGRWYHYSWKTQPPLPLREIIRSSANMHMVPSDANVAAALADLRPGEVVTIHGWLIEARSPDGWRWRSSTSRNDSGGGACELVWVESLMREAPPQG